jgi:hypothetical protein
MRSEDPSYASAYDQTYRLTEDEGSRDDLGLPTNAPDDQTAGDAAAGDGSPDAGTP